MIRLLVADDHPVYLSGLRALLDAEPDMTVVAVASTGVAAHKAAIDQVPDVAVLDVSMPDGDGLWVAAQLRTASLPTKTLILTMYDDDEKALAAVRAGAHGYAVKRAGGDDIVAAVRAVARGDAIFGSAIAARLLSRFAHGAANSPFPQLTDREHEVLALLARGLDNPAIARRLGVSGKTVRNHVSNVIAKLQVADRTGAILRARDAGLGTNPGQPS